jgi:hypothetical protein
MHSTLENLPVIIDAAGTKMQVQHGLGNMAVGYNEFPAMPKTPNLLEGLPNDSCPCPHWGYMLKGSVHIRYDDGEEEVVRAGEVFYYPPGHVGWSDEETAWIEFSPEKEMNMVMEHIGKKMQGMGQ